MHFSANARSWDRMSSFRLSVTLVGDLEILETNYTGNYPNTFALCSQNAIHLIPGEHGEILERLEVG